MNYAHPTRYNLPAYVLTTGVKVESREGDPTTVGVTLASGTTYVFPLGGESAPLEMIHIVWDAAIIVTFTVETTGLGKNWGSQVDVSDFDSVAGNWMQENPTTVYVSGSGAGGMTATNLSLAVAGGTRGGSTIHMGNFGAPRSRIKAVVAGTGGVVRVAVHGKA